MIDNHLTNDCPYPDVVYLADSYVKQKFGEHVQIVGMFITDKPSSGKVHAYRRIETSEYREDK